MATEEAPFSNIPEVPMHAPARGQKAIRVERTAIEQAQVIQQQQAQIADLQNQLQALASRNEQLEASVVARQQEIAGVWGEVVKIKQSLRMP